MKYKLTFVEYTEALKQNKILGMKCACGSISATPRMACKKCASTDLEIINLSGKGKIKSFTTIFVAGEGREDEVPYVLVMVELAEGPWIMGNLATADPNAASMETLMGKEVQMTEAKVFAGDKYSAGESARPLFALAG
ncbi:Zn-ribbon domain-containing OB-fold protein [Chloroflexota bacterium]